MKTIFYGDDQQDTVKYWNNPELNYVDNVLATVEEVKVNPLVGYEERGSFSEGNIEWTHNFMKKCNLSDNALIGEIGSGGGRMIITLDMVCKKYGYNWQLVGFEHSQNAVDVSRIRLPSREFWCVSGTDLPIDDRRFDLIYTFTCLQHNSGWKQDLIFDAVYNTLKPDGQLMLFNESTFDTDHWDTRYIMPLSPWVHDIRESAGTPAWWISRLADHWFELRDYTYNGFYLFKKVPKIEGRVK